MKVNVMQRNYQILYGKINMPTQKPILCGLYKDRACKPEAKRCLLCLTEEYHIIFSKLNGHNSRNKLVTNCRHENKFYLANFKDSTRNISNIIDDN